MDSPQSPSVRRPNACQGTREFASDDSTAWDFRAIPARGDVRKIFSHPASGPTGTANAASFGDGQVSDTLAGNVLGGAMYRGAHETIETEREINLKHSQPMFAVAGVIHLGFELNRN